MKKQKFLIFIIFIFSIIFLGISLLLPSCSTPPSPSTNNPTISGETQRLSNELPLQNIEDLEESSKTENIKYLVGGTKESGEIDINNEFEKTEAENASSDRNLLATYSSKVYTKTEDRQKNLRIVCDKLSGTILKPNQEFSYNETCGPYNKENGFGKATIFLGDGTEKQDYGGGVCQLSSTLYNAVKNLNVEILERHNHSKKVYYVPDGQDATVSYGNLDFRFKNLNDYSILLEATSDAESVDVSVYKI